MNKSSLLKGMSILAFCISAFFSVSNLYSMAFTLLTGIVCGIMGVILEYSKVYCIYKGFTDKRLPTAIRTLCILVYMILLTASIFFSMAFIGNEENSNTEYTSAHSKQALQQEESIKTDTNSIIRLQGQIDTVKSQYETSIVAKQSYINGLPKNYITAKETALKDLDKIKKEMTDKIALINNQISGVETSKKVSLSTVVTVKNDTTGFTSLLKTITDWHNSTERGKENIWTLAQVAFVFYLILSIVFEIVASLLYFLSEHEREFGMCPSVSVQKTGSISYKDEKEIAAVGYRTPSPLQKGDPVIAKSSLDIPNQNLNQGLELGTSNKINNHIPDELKSKNPIGFQAPVPGSKIEVKKPIIKREVLQKYIKSMMSTVEKDGYVGGYQKISKLAGITPNDGKECRGHLINIGTVETSGVRTRLIKK